MRTIYLWAIIIGLTDGVTNGEPPSVEDMRRNAIAAAEAMEEAYQHVKMLTKESRRDPSTNEVAYVTTNEYLCEGDLVRGTVTVVTSREPTMATGVTRAFGGSAKEFFYISKQDGGREFSIDSIGPSKDFALVTRGKARPIFAPYCIYNVRLVDYLNDKDVKFLSADTNTIDGEVVAEILTEYMFREAGSPPIKLHYRLYFATDTWALRGFVQHLPANPERNFFHERLTYEPGSNPPRLKRFEVWGESRAEPGKKIGGMIVGVESLEFGEIDSDEFTLAAFGVETPVNYAQLSTTSSGFSWVTIGTVAGFGLLGLLLAVVAVRQHRRPSGPSKKLN